MDNFYEKLYKQLKKMTEQEKDAWILSQAKILPEWEQEDFYKSVCGTKKIIHMPEISEIDEFCMKVENGDISIEYETHYVEFDDYGHFHDDWEQDFHDPAHAMTFLSSVFNGCHDLIILEEYAQALEILDKVITLEFTLVDHPNTDDTCADEFMSLNVAAREGLLSINRNNLLKDYILACRKTVSNKKLAAEKIVLVLEMDLFKDSKTFSGVEITAQDPLLEEIKKKLADDLQRYEDEFTQKRGKDDYYPGEYQDQARIRHIQALIEFFGKIGKKEKKLEKSFLRGTWEQIMNLISDLRYEFIDDQVEIEEIWKIIEALLKRGGFDQEPWEVKQEILEAIYENDYYDYYGVCDPMRDLANAVCSNREENLKRAAIMMKAGRGYLGAKAAKLYWELGEEEKCAEYFENHLEKEEEPYIILVDYYKNRNHEKAVEIANLAIQKCKKDQTPFFLFLLQDAKDRGDEALFKKLMQSAHRRRTVSSAEIDEKFPITTS